MRKPDPLEAIVRIFRVCIDWIRRAMKTRKELEQMPETVKVSEGHLKDREKRGKEMVDRVTDLDKEMKCRGLRPIQNVWLHRFHDSRD